MNETQNETQKRSANWSNAVEQELQERACRCQEEAGRAHSECVTEAQCTVRQQLGRLS